jgi:hypothetical protein
MMPDEGRMAGPTTPFQRASGIEGHIHHDDNQEFARLSLGEKGGESSLDEVVNSSRPGYLRVGLGRYTGAFIVLAK